MTDIPLTLNPAVALELRAQRPGRNPKFVCSLEEFERLLELGDAGWEIPQAVMLWQDAWADVPLTDHLGRMAAWTDTGSRWRFDLQRWLDDIPVENRNAPPPLRGVA